MEDNQGHHSCMSTDGRHHGCNGIQTNGITWDTNYWYPAQLTWGHGNNDQESDS